MYASFDRNSPTPLNGDALSLSWKGDGGQGWLACGTSRKTVGVTYTEVKDEEDFRCGDLFYEREMQDFSLERQGMRRNFNFREHSQEVRNSKGSSLGNELATGVFFFSRRHLRSCRNVSCNCMRCWWESARSSSQKHMADR